MLAKGFCCANTLSFEAVAPTCADCYASHVFTVYDSSNTYRAGASVAVTDVGLHLNSADERVQDLPVSSQYGPLTLNMNSRGNVVLANGGGKNCTLLLQLFFIFI